ncbi:hypothetical protein SCLCIDRAFT_1098896 [Scleroderma citrinum Foug A]|uniref:Uncharacterized protein n=1 Tax=Scleroderma citrinum Foug A TaxID=1036808 RepID=A0A0C3DPS0_9AGAM|nr:hypothetical protein SCLCIDRAFT_1098896 [Scleroderma citrinum Foug A]
MFTSNCSPAEYLTHISRDLHSILPSLSRSQPDRSSLDHARSMRSFSRSSCEGAPDGEYDNELSLVMYALAILLQSPWRMSFLSVRCAPSDVAYHTGLVVSLSDVGGDRWRLRIIMQDVPYGPAKRERSVFWILSSSPTGPSGRPVMTERRGRGDAKNAWARKRRGRMNMRMRGVRDFSCEVR